MFEFLKVGETRHVGGGTLEARVKDPLEHDEPGEVALHEAEHAFVGDENGTGIVEVSIIPQEGSLGHVLFTRSDPVAGVAPHANGRSGTGHDIRMVEKSGMSLGSAMRAARRKMAGREEDIRKIAGFVQSKKHVSGEAFRRAKRKITEGDDVEITYTSQTGEKKRATKTGVKDSHMFIIEMDFSM